ncbi:hypothetical protein GE061_015241 [Apolygus lucorum]|uniref:Uncharacterized protein n=1 Tax=Apolygus lucorum TaxID=248454 RepID=A0A8S9XLM0_APOLU|nr:hypothetical protein GE061_015241 [Apolygus lucorum]
MQIRSGQYVPTPQWQGVFFPTMKWDCWEEDEPVQEWHDLRHLPGLLPVHRTPRRLSGNQLNVPQEMSALMVYSYWLGTVCCMAAGIVFSSVSAVLAVVNSATTPIWTITGVPGLYLWNIVSILFQGGAVALWATLYFRQLQFSIMTSDDRWSTEGRAFFGLSFWLVVASIGVQIINVIFIYSATSDMRQKKKAAKPVIEEKTNGAIMLY